MPTNTTEKRILVRQGGSVIPLVQHALRRSETLASRGVLIEQHAFKKTEFPKRELLSHVIYLHTGSSVQAEISSHRVSGRKWIRPGMVWVMPQGTEHAVAFLGKSEGLGISFTAERFAQLLAAFGSVPQRQLDDNVLIDEVKLNHLSRALWYESLAPSEPGLLTAECIAAALALTLAQLSPRDEEAQWNAKSGLTGRQLQLIRDFVRDHIAEPIALQVLADLVGLSPFHFIRSFKRSTGTTPHQFVLEQRIAVAKDLLRLERYSIAEAAAKVGFAHPTHFARAFRKEVGVAPGEYVRGR